MRKFSIDKVPYSYKPSTIEEIRRTIIPRKVLRKFEIYDLYDLYDAVYVDENDFIDNQFMSIGEIPAPPQRFILECDNGRTYFVNTEGFNYARYIVELVTC